jgi:hypothetical protein
MKQRIQHWLGQIGNRLLRLKASSESTATSAPEPERAGEAPGHRSLPKIINDCTDLLTEIENMGDSLDEAARPLAEHLKIHLQEIIERAGAIRIEEEAEFDVTRHQVIPARRINTGEPISETIVPGYMFEGRVLKRARVRV